jgi:glycine/D-amino acid oxidase-like deaminating enzyme
VSELGTLDTADIVVVGGGISGLCTAYELRRRGFDVVLVEQRFIAFGATGRNPGALWVQTRRAGLELELARRGLHKYEEYIDEFGNVFEHRREGGLFFFETDEQGKVMEEYVEDRRALGIDVELLSLTETKARSELVPDTAIGAVFCMEDSQIDATAFANALIAAGVRAGIRKFENTAVLGTLRRGDDVIGVRTVRGDVHAAGVVWATGAWAVNLRAEGLQFPMTTARMGHLITQPVSQRARGVLHGPRGVEVCGALKDLSSYRPELFGLGEVGSANGSLSYDDSITQNPAGALYLGSSIDGRGSLNPHISLSATRAMVETAQMRFHEYNALGIVGLWAGLMCETPDQLPIVDRIEGTYINTGHAWGLTSGPICGQLIAEMIANEPSPLASKLAASRMAARSV